MPKPTPPKPVGPEITPELAAQLDKGRTQAKNGEGAVATRRTTTVEHLEAITIEEGVAALLSAVGVEPKDIIELQVNPRLGRLRIIGSDRSVRSRNFAKVVPSEH